ncbi:Rho-GTPase-activating protein 8 [Malassezia cuniculi]|uniref:Rho-GTPase-activating protein 8 n=1 Tax=Malassezia cuniculi TaxID=948313 RepID=A0AAF0ET73_9BASI|nr:Rho-GTPase-activating protein 8 [Malassezia cuniculi]
MTTPARLSIAYTPTFSSSFWSYPEYRPGAISLYSRLQEGLDEDESLLHFFQQRVIQERAYASNLAGALDTVPLKAPLFEGAGEIAHTGRQPRGFRGGSTPTARACRVLASECATAHADAHLLVAQSIEQDVVQPFRRWAEGHSARVHESWNRVDSALYALEQQQAEVSRLRASYEAKSRMADEAEEDMRFAPASQPDSLQRSVSMMSLTSGALRRASRLVEPKKDAEQYQERQDQLQGVPDVDREQRREQLRQQFGFKSRPVEEVHIDAADISGDTSTDDTSFQAPEQGSLTRQPSRLSTYFSRAVGAVSGLADPRHVRLRRDAEAAESAYQDAVRTVDELRCEAEEVLFSQYAAVQRWEADRVAAVRRIIARYNSSVSTLAPALQASVERTGVIPEQIHASAQLQQLVHESATGSFRPVPTVFQPYYHDDINAVAGIATAGFGMNLIATARCEALAAQESGKSGAAMPSLPPVLHALLSALQRSYADRARWHKDGEKSEAEANAEKRRVWLYEVPVNMTHGLRRRLIEHVATETDRSNTTSLSFAIPDRLLDAVDAPVLAATVKLWALELETPLIPYSMWDEIAEIYTAASLIESAPASDAPDAPDNAADASASILRGLRTVLSRLHTMHLTCVDAFICHLYKLIKATPTDEDDDRYTSRLGLSLGRALLRPATERPSVMNSRYPALLLKDLITHYEDLFPELMLSKVKETDVDALAAKGTIRRRSRPIDQRISRSSLRDAPDAGIQRRAAQFVGPRLSMHMNAAPEKELPTPTAERKELPTPKATPARGTLLPGSREEEIRKAEQKLTGGANVPSGAESSKQTKETTEERTQMSLPHETNAPTDMTHATDTGTDTASSAATASSTTSPVVPSVAAAAAADISQSSTDSASDISARDIGYKPVDDPNAAPLMGRQTSLTRSRPVSGRFSGGNVRGSRTRK